MWGGVIGLHTHLMHSSQRPGNAGLCHSQSRHVHPVLCVCGGGVQEDMGYVALSPLIPYRCGVRERLGTEKTRGSPGPRIARVSTCKRVEEHGPKVRGTHRFGHGAGSGEAKVHEISSPFPRPSWGALMGMLNQGWGLQLRRLLPKSSL